jgi:hypothetical protein
VPVVGAVLKSQLCGVVPRTSGVRLSYVNYKGYVIIASASLDETTGQWRPVASISWHRAGQTTRGVKLFTDLSETFASSADATSFAMAIAKNWIDRHRGVVE